MKTIKLVYLAVLVIMLSPMSAHAISMNEPAPDFTLTDVDGAEYSLSDFAGKFVVLEWVNYDCPFVRKHYDSGNMQGLQEKYEQNGVVWLSINSSAEGKQGYFPNEELKERIKKENAKPAAYLVDTDGSVGRLYEAKTTPHMYVINPEGKLIYQGAIDDTPSTNPGDIETSENYIRSCFQKALNGEAVSTSSTKSYGCSVKY